jgi:RNase adaptor protein for sRNA GlmZ degradation
MEPFVVVTGYARMGKTTTMGLLEKMGYYCESSSKINHEVTQSILSIFNKSVDRSDKNAIIKIDEDSVTYRDVLIKVAEDVLKANLGNDVYVNAMKTERNTAYEIFSEVELNELCSRLKMRYEHVKPLVLRIDRPNQCIINDGRQLIPYDHLVVNDGSIEDLENKLLFAVKTSYNMVNYDCLRED